MNEQYTNRVRLSELDDAIFQPNKEEVRSQSFIPVLYFAFSGNEDSLVTLDGHESNDGYPTLTNPEDEQAVCAKRTFYPRDGQYRYYVKRSSRGTLVNPIDMYDEGLYNRVTHGVSNVKYSEVPKKAFMHYINFLKTKNVAHLRNAEREAM